MPKSKRDNVLSPHVLKVHNVMGIEDYIVEFDKLGKRILTRGKNGTGKTSLYIAAQLAGTNMKLPGYRVVRTGTDGAIIEFEAGGFVFSAEVTTDAKGEEHIRHKVKSRMDDGKLKIESADVFETLKTWMALDPLRMYRRCREGGPAGKRDVGDMVKSGIKVDADLSLYGIEPKPGEHPLDAIARRRDELFRTRTDSSRDLKALEVRASAPYVVAGQSYSSVPAQFKDAKPQSVADLTADMNRLTKIQRENDSKRQNLSFVHTQRAQATAARQQAEKALAEAVEREKVLKNSEDLLTAEVDKLADPNLRGLETAIAQAGLNNAWASAFAARKTVIGDREAKRDEVTQLTSDIAELDDLTATVQKTAKLPLDKMRYDPEEGVIVTTEKGDVPLACRSEGEGTGDCAELACALLESRDGPKLGIMPVDRAEGLDDDTKARIETTAAKHDIVVWYFEVDPSQSELVIE